ncbi:response regulator [Nitrincola lacisaponensis]|uniref:Response regulator n=1 Tax=Nitrincola lacisaponensis TaxID=267850 RepID=A0A063YA69_9GAMM|nr:HDOD domain-containing protein [Nitrincola lacisaponensis]KDE41222.1 response regulator [Nitrincola lacisaponensis]
MLPFHLVICDDEEAIVHSLQRQFRRLYPECRISGFTSAEILQHQLMNLQPDALIADLKLQDGDGRELLQQMATLHPHSIRVLMSGISEQAPLLDALQYCHRILIKPFNQSDLESIYDCLQHLSSLQLEHSERRLLGQLTGLPNRPEIMLSITRALAEETPDLQTIADKILEDPALLTRILTWANSPIFGFQSSTEDLKTALMRLGLDTLNHLIMMLSVRQQLMAYNHPVANQLIEEAQALAHHSSQMCSEMALSPRQRNQVIIAALLHNLGKQIRLLEYLHTDQTAPLNPEFLSQRHVHLGAGLLLLWDMDQEIAEAILRQYQDPQETKTFHPAYLLQRVHQKISHQEVCL